MAKQVGPHFMTGTIDGVIFYKLGDQYYVRSKGDYRSAKQMRKDPRLKRTMENADQFGKATKLLKPIYYRYLPKAVRKHGLFGKLTGMVHRWLQEGKGKEEVKAILIAHCQNLASITVQRKVPDEPSNLQPAFQQQQSTDAKLESAGYQQQQAGNTQRSIVSETCTVIHQTRSADNSQLTKSNAAYKQARYLSKWKVKSSGRLHIPRRCRVMKSLTSEGSSVVRLP